MSEESSQTTTMTRKVSEEINVPTWAIESFKQSVESWLNIYGAVLLDKVIDKYVQQTTPLLKEVNSTLKSIEEKLGNVLPLSQITVIQEIGYEDAKRMVQSYLEEHKKADTEELLLKLNVNLETLVKILDELKQEDKIEAID
jgi:hypothetical protein